MKRILSLSLLCSLAILLHGQEDPLHVESYTLSNGLTVYLNEDHNVPMVQGMVVVKGGAKRDPAEATGVAHYFEHIMFKGSDELGTIDYESEKPYLDSIRILYDKLGETAGEEERAGIQAEINRVSLKAAEYAIPNEFDEVVADMGGTNINASTGYECIDYYNSFPSNQIEKWLELYSHRFIHPVYRLFQSELETVYEEKNMSLDDPFDQWYESYLKNFFRNSPYGQQTILGTVEDLKNPSLSLMAEYYDKYYVANNMALILSGDFEAEVLKPLIEEKFGRWRSGPEIPDLELKEDPFKGREFVSARMTPIKAGGIGFRSVPRNHEDEVVLEVISNLLSNYASTGLLDELVNENELMMVAPMPFQSEELGGFNILFIPKIIGQSLGSAEKKVNGQIEKLKLGAFSDELLQGVKTELRIDYETYLEDLEWRTYFIEDAFVYGYEWEELLERPETIRRISREEVMEAANRYFGDDKLVYHSKMGFPKKAKLDKPPYDAVESSSSEKQSEYAAELAAIPVLDMEPRFIDYDRDIRIEKPASGITTYVTLNPINGVFSLDMKFYKGEFQDPLISPTANLVTYASPAGKEYQAFRQELQLLGGEVNATSELNYTTLHITGLEENLEGILRLIHKLITAFDVKEKQIEKVVQAALMDKKFEEKDIYTKSRALFRFALYGDQSEYLVRLQKNEMKALSPEDIRTKFDEITTHACEVHYCGKLDHAAFQEAYRECMPLPGPQVSAGPFLEKEPVDHTGNIIYLLDDKKAVQSHIRLYIEGEVNDEASRTALQGFNQYMDGGMSSILFQEIREFRSLAYAVGGGYAPAFNFDKPGYFWGVLTTQSDKTTDALKVFRDIMTDLPRKPERMESVRNSLTLSINSSQPSFRNKSATASTWIRQGYAEDPRKSRYDAYVEMSFDEIQDFFNSNLKGKPWVVAIVGDTRRMNLEELEKYGEIRKVGIKKIFN